MACRQNYYYGVVHRHIDSPQRCRQFGPEDLLIPIADVQRVWATVALDVDEWT